MLTGISTNLSNKISQAILPCVSKQTQNQNNCKHLIEIFLGSISIKKETNMKVVNFNSLLTSLVILYKVFLCLNLDL